jgi:phenylacetic acid degradation operon negative regulatory protein
MLFTLWGVYIRHFGSEIPLSAVLRLMDEFGFAGPAVRVAVSRLAEQGWVALRKAGRNRYLSMTAKGLERVDEAATRIYRLRPERWDGYWLLLTYTIPEEQRAARDQLRADLAWWGFGTLSPGTWLSPHSLSPALAARLDSPEVAPYLDYFQARYSGPSTSAALVVKGWRLEEVFTKYYLFLEKFGPELAAARSGALSEQECFVRRCRLVHEYRKFLFVDPGLPEELLAADWPGGQAFDLFHAYDQLLAGPAARYFYTVYLASGGSNLAPERLKQSLEAALNPFGPPGSYAPEPDHDFRFEPGNPIKEVRKQPQKSVSSESPDNDKPGLAYFKVLDGAPVRR